MKPFSESGCCVPGDHHSVLGAIDLLDPLSGKQRKNMFELKSLTGLEPINALQWENTERETLEEASIDSKGS